MPTYAVSISGVPLVFGRRRAVCGDIVRDRIDPLSGARGLLSGLMAAIVLWSLIVAAIGVV